MGTIFRYFFLSLSLLSLGCQNDIRTSAQLEAALGPCSGTPAECEAARVVNEYRTSHFHLGECNNPLRWNEEIGRLAHEYQDGPFVHHSDYGYLENVGQAFDVRQTAKYIVQYEPGEPHCKLDGSHVMSHHCAAMYCGIYTIGVGVFEQNGAIYMTMMFGDENGQP